MKRYERSFAYRGIIALAVGAVLAVPGAIAQWWPQLFHIENSRNIRPMVAAASLTVGCIVMAAGALYAGYHIVRFILCQTAKRGGKQVTARLLAVEADYSHLAFGKPSYIVRCLHTGADGARRLFTSCPLRCDPTPQLAEALVVWVNPAKPARYYVDITASLQDVAGK